MQISMRAKGYRNAAGNLDTQQRTDLLVALVRKGSQTPGGFFRFLWKDYIEILGLNNPESGKGPKKRILGADRNRNPNKHYQQYPGKLVFSWHVLMIFPYKWELINKALLNQLACSGKVKQ
jgi:hypothetical protein